MKSDVRYPSSKPRSGVMAAILVVLAMFLAAGCGDSDETGSSADSADSSDSGSDDTPQDEGDEGTDEPADESSNGEDSGVSTDEGDPDAEDADAGPSTSDSEDTPAEEDNTDDTTDGTDTGEDAAGDDDVAPSQETLRILMTNDDGVAAEGLSVVVEAVAALPDVEVIVSAPADQQSGTSDMTTEGDVGSSEATTAAGYPATAVDGFPADAVLAGLDALDEAPHLVVSGINEGQNVGPFVEISGTVGAARTGARNGIPAIAASQAIAEPINFDAGAGVVADWITENRDALLAGTIEPTVVNYNFASCPDAMLRGVVDVPTAVDFGDRNMSEIDCEADVEPADDVDAIISGYASMTELPF